MLNIKLSFKEIKMEILLVLLLVSGVLYWAYQQVNKPDTQQMNEPAGTPTVPPPTEPAPVVETVKSALDVNKDGQVNVADVKEAVKKTRARVKKAADQDGDGRVTVKDIKVAASKARSAATKTMAKTPTPRAKK